MDERLVHIVVAAACWVGVAACAPLRPSVSLRPGASLAGYRAFHVEPVADQTGYVLSPELLDVVRRELRARLEEAHHRAAEGPQDTLTIVSTLTEFTPGSPFLLDLPSHRRSRCVLRSALVDKGSGTTIGVIVASEDHDGAALSVLRTCARIVADEINRRSFDAR